MVLWPAAFLAIKPQQTGPAAWLASLRSVHLISDVASPKLVCYINTLCVTLNLVMLHTNHVKLIELFTKRVRNEGKIGLQIVISQKQNRARFCSPSNDVQISVCQ